MGFHRFTLATFERKMDKNEEYLNCFFTYIATLCLDKAKDHIDKEKIVCKVTPNTPWNALINMLPQIAMLEKNYMELGFLHNKNKTFLRKDNSLKAMYDHINIELKKIEDSNIQSDFTIFCQNISQFLIARKQLMELYPFINNTAIIDSQSITFRKFPFTYLIISYENVLSFSTTNASKSHNCVIDLLSQIESISLHNLHSFTGITMTPVKAAFNVECEILKSLLVALKEMSQLHFFPSLASIYGAHTRLNVWERRIENRESWKLGFLKNTQLPLLFQWHIRLKAAVLSKFSFYFYDILCKQTTLPEMSRSCLKLQYDYYSRMTAFQKKYDVFSIMLVTDSVPSNVTDEFGAIIVSSPPKQALKMDDVRIRVVSELAYEITVPDKIRFNYNDLTQQTHIITLVEPNTYLVLIFDSKKTEKDIYINNFILEFSSNLRCLRVFASIKNQNK